MENVLDLMMGLTNRMDRFEHRVTADQQLPARSPSDALPLPQVTLSPKEPYLPDEYVLESEVSPPAVESEEPLLQSKAPVTVETYLFPFPLENTGPEDENEEAPARENFASIPLGHSTTTHKLMKT